MVKRLQYVVKSFRWLNGSIESIVRYFDHESEAMEYSNSVMPATTVKIYVEDEVVFSVTKQDKIESYA
jgi:hypothetical protein